MKNERVRSVMKILNANSDDIISISELFDEARKTIASLGIDQWQNGYPSKDIIEEDISLSRSYCVKEDEKLCGTFVMITDGEPTYDKIYDGHWITGDDNYNYVAIHRVAVSVSMRGRGISTAIIEYVSEFARNLNRSSLRIDTHKGNVVMRRMLEKHGFKYCGIIFLQNGEERVAYEKII